MTEKEIYQAIYGKRKSEKVVPSKGKKGKRKRMPTKNRTEWGWRFPDGREICDLETGDGRIEYSLRRGDMWVRDQGLCCICHKFVPFKDCEFEHALGKGMNGSHRDDRIEGNGVAHHDCNMAKGSKRAVSLKSGRAGSGE